MASKSMYKILKSIYNKCIRWIAGKIVHKKVNLNLSEAIVSFAFDDVPHSGFMYGSNIYKKYGFRSTYYVALGFFEKNRQDGPYYEPKYLQQALDEGSELASHTYGHLHFSISNKKQIIEDLNKNQKRINEFFPEYKFVNFSYPYGEQTIASKRIMLNRFKTARGVKGGINYGVIDLIDLKSHQLGNHFQMEDIKFIIDETIRLKGWLIFYTHEVESNPTAYGCTPEMFEFAAQYCYQKRVSVLTVKEAIETIEKTTS